MERLPPLLVTARAPSNFRAGEKAAGGMLALAAQRTVRGAKKPPPTAFGCPCPPNPSEAVFWTPPVLAVRWAGANGGWRRRAAARSGRHPH